MEKKLDHYFLRWREIQISYVSVLYKFKNHSLAYRNFLDVGIGLYAASYDLPAGASPFAGGRLSGVITGVGRGFCRDCYCKPLEYLGNGKSKCANDKI